MNSLLFRMLLTKKVLNTSISFFCCQQSRLFHSQISASSNFSRVSNLSNRLRFTNVHVQRSLICARGFSHGDGEAQMRAATPQEHEQSSGAPPKQEQSSSRWSKYSGKNSWKPALFIISFSVCSGFAYLLFTCGPPERDEQGNVIEDQFSAHSLPVGYLRRAINVVFAFNQSIRDPVSDKLLPDVYEYPYYQPPYTLVFEIDGFLLHGDWTFKTGWRFKKRPGLDFFLQQLSPFFEVVVYTRESGITATPILNQMDPEGKYVPFRLFRESTRYKNGHHIKDLSCLNRDLSKVIFIDWDPAACQLQPRNCFLLKKWTGDDSDRDLIDLVAFLRMMAMNKVEDVRVPMDVYKEYPDPLAEFRLRHDNLIQNLKQKQQEKAKQMQKPTSPFSTGLGLKSRT